jgi:AcrR family transcriptional regulator
MSTVGRPRQHDEHTAKALLDAAERIVETEGVAVLSVRRLADDVGTSTRAVYSIFGSKEALVTALGCRAFDWLATALDNQPRCDDPATDVVEAGATTFRRLVVEHPALFRTGIQKADVAPQLAAEFRAAADGALQRVEERLRRLQDAGQLGERTLLDAAREFHALCEGLGALELRGALGPSAAAIWRDAIGALVAGFSAGVAGRPAAGRGRTLAPAREATRR